MVEEDLGFVQYCCQMQFTLLFQHRFLSKIKIELTLLIIKKKKKEIAFVKILLTDLHRSIYHAVLYRVDISLGHFENEIHKQV